MALKPAICTQCGGQIEVDDSKEAGNCQFCGTAFITEKVINQYVTQNNFAGATINIQGGIEDENLYVLARRAVEQENIDDILKYYGQLVERHPNDWEAVLYLSFFKGDDTIVLPNIELALNLLFDSVVVTRNGNYEEIVNKVGKIISLFDKKYGKNDSWRNNEISLRAFADILLKILDNQIIHNNNKLNWNLCLILNLIITIERCENYFYYYYHLREALNKLLKLDFDDNLSEEDIDKIKKYLLKWFDWFMTAPVFLGLGKYDELIDSCKFIEYKKKQKLGLYKSLLNKYTNLLNTNEKKTKEELIKRVLILEAELPQEQREITNKLKEKKIENKKLFFVSLFIILILGVCYFFSYLETSNITLQDFFQELLK